MCKRRSAVSSVRLGAFDPFAFHQILRRAQAGGIKQPQCDPAQIDSFFNGIAGGAVHLAHNRAIKSEHAIEQTRFARVGRAENHNAKSLTQNSTGLSGRD